MIIFFKPFGLLIISDFMYTLKTFFKDFESASIIISPYFPNKLFTILRVASAKFFEERYDNFIPFYLQYGDNFIEILKNSLNPLDANFVVLSH